MNSLGLVKASVVEHGARHAAPAATSACLALRLDSQLNEHMLIDRLRDGDPAARAAAVRRYHSALVLQASRILRDKGLAEDAVQDSWLAAFACIDGFNPRYSLFGWLVRIVINRAKGLRRREVRSLPFSAWQSPWSGGELQLPVTADDASPEWLLLEREALRRFNEALQALPESQRTVVLLRDFAGASSGEACRVLQINDLTLRVRLCRARASIRQALFSESVRDAA